MKKYLSALCCALAFFAFSVEAVSVESVSVHSDKMNKDVPVTILLPDSYATAGATRFPVLYLLHGAGDTDKKWKDSTDIEDLVDQYNIIAVCPAAGRTSWYFDSPIDPNYQYETFVSSECVSYIDKHYRTKADKSHRALCGNSMGGHGALFLGIRHRDVFSMSVVLSGGVDIRPFPNNWDIKKRIGTIETHRDNWEKLTVINLAKTLKDGDLNISIDCGSGDFFLKVNRALHEQLQKDGIAHEYIEQPGGHSWDYWNKAIKRQMPLIKKHFSAK